MRICISWMVDTGFVKESKTLGRVRNPIGIKRAVLKEKKFLALHRVK